MILYFSGTGNSEYVAKRIGKAIGDEVVNLFDKIKESDFTEMRSERDWVIVVPTYAWRIPRTVQNWIEKTPFAGSGKMYFAMTCGGNIGNADKYLSKLCKAKDVEYMGCAQIVMPENYVAMFYTPEQAEALQIIDDAESGIDAAAEFIKDEKPLPRHIPTLTDRVESAFVNGVFYKTCVHAKAFYATDKCISCGLCEKVCPLSNVSLKNGKPAWGDDCTHCMACICRCPKEAIEYGKHSVGLPRYVCPKTVE